MSCSRKAGRQADAARQRALYLAGLPDVGIPPDGAAYILRRDPLSQGSSVLERRCLGCHVFDGKGTGTQTASDLKHFGTRAVGSRPARKPGIGELLRHGQEVRRHERVERRLEAHRQRARPGGRLRRDVRLDSRGHDAGDWLNSPGSPSTPGSSRSRGMRNLPRRSRA